MAQVIPGFDAAAFRDGIRTAMIMGLPVQTWRQPQFVILTDPSETADADSDGVPWDVVQQMVRPQETLVRVPCAIQWGDRTEDTRQFGPLQPGYIEVVLLDEDYAQVEGFHHVLVWPTNGAPVRYLYRRVLMQPNLDTVGVWVLECATEDVV